MELRDKWEETKGQLASQIWRKQEGKMDSKLRR